MTPLQHHMSVQLGEHQFVPLLHPPAPGVAWPTRPLPPRPRRRKAVNEATLLAKLSHPNIVGYWDSFLHGTPPDLLVCIVMDYADGGDLSGYLERQKGRLLDEELVLDW